MQSQDCIFSINLEFSGINPGIYYHARHLGNLPKEVYCDGQLQPYRRGIDFFELARNARSYCVLRACGVVLGRVYVLCWPRDSKPATQDVYSLASRPYVVVASQHDMVWYASLAGLAERIEGAVEGATLFRSGKVGLQMLACSCYAVCADGCVASNIELM